MSVRDIRAGSAKPPGRRRHRFFQSNRARIVLVASAAVGISIAIPAVSFADNGSDCYFPATGPTQSCSGPLAGSTFPGGERNPPTNPQPYCTYHLQNPKCLTAVLH